jgi:hypothetical protein
MTESNPFAAAQKILREKYEKCRTPLGTYAGGEEKADSIEVVLRLLEAAGKVDKERASSCVADWHEATHAARYCYMKFLEGHDCDQVRDVILALLAALPDKVTP